MATQEEVATHIDLTSRQVRNLINDGVLPAGPTRGELDLNACRMAYIAYLRELANKRGANRPADSEDEKVRLTRAQAEKAEFENAVRQGEFMPIQAHGELLDILSAEVARQMAALPSIAGEIAGMSDKALVRARLLKECNDVRDAFARRLGAIADGLQSGDSDEIPQGAGDREGSVEIVAGRVGTSESPPAAGVGGDEMES